MFIETMLICKPLISKESVVVKLSLVLVAMMLLISCSSKEQDALMKVHQQKQDQYKYLQKTEKVQFKENNITSMTVTATYMNKPTTDLDDTSDEVFLVGIFGEENEIESLTSDEFNLTLREVKSRKERKEEAKKERAERKEQQRMLEALDNNETNSTLFKKKKKKAVYLRPIYVKHLDKNSPLLKGISFVSEWSQFYLVHYKHVAGNRLSLRVQRKKSEAQMQIDTAKAKAKADAKVKAQVSKKKKSKHKKVKKKKKIKVPTHQSAIISFAKVAKYAL